MLDLINLGRKLLACRTRLQYSVGEILESTGIETARYQLIESGKSEPTGDEILIFADFFQEDYRYFISNISTSANENIDSLYREFGGDFSKEDRRSIQEFLFLCQCEQEVWETLRTKNKDFIPKKTVYNYKTQNLSVTSDLRAILGYKENDLIENLFDDFRSLGIHIFRRKLNNSGISGVFILHPIAGKCVLVNYSDDVYRQNFTVAHEVAHSLYDHDDTFNVSFTKSGGDIREMRANDFAAQFLMPAKAFCGIKVSKFNTEIVLRLAEQFRVNVIALLYRLKDLKLINFNEFNELKTVKLPISIKKDVELTKLPERLRLGKQKLLELGLSSYYVRKCHEVYAQGEISKSRLAEMLLCQELELPEILILFSLKLTYEF